MVKKLKSVPKGFRLAKSEFGTLVQKSRFRLGSIGERAEIIKARRGGIKFI